MALAFTVLEIVTPVFLLAAIGYIWVKLGFEYRVQFVTQIAMTLAVPFLIFVSLMQTEITPQMLADISMATVMAYLAVGGAGFAILKAFGLSQRTFLPSLLFSNTGNVGMPLAFFAFGQTGLGYAIVVFAIMAIISFTFGVWLVVGGGSPGKLLKEPLIPATLLSGFFMVQGWQTPVFLTNSLTLIGQMAIPLMLITLGVAVARLRPGRLTQAIALAFVKLIICSAAAWAAGWYFDLEPIAFAILVLQLTTPVAVTSYLLAEKYGADAQSVAGLVVVSSLMSVLSLPILITILL
ncbi:MAG: AEC family transporter [Rhodobacteraceae bacterium]|nr:AEC family transporter [Paracoccaceae bacterium]